jgi:GNAT superfamily N-acetyltransferase
MANSADPSMVVLTEADVEAGLRLSGEMGWNQLPADWLLYLRHGHTVGFRRPDGVVVGTGAAMPYEGGYGYLALVLVTADWRRRGLGTRLVEHSIDWLEGQGMVPLLDATEAAAEGYRRQAFAPVIELDRWEADLPAAEGAAAGAGPHEIELAMLVGLDAQAFGATRPHLLDDIRRRPGVRGVVGAEGRGVAMIRPGRRAAQIGPLVAPDDRTAVALLDEVLRGAAGAVIIDVPKARTAFGEALEAKGFSRRRSFLRMARGRPPEPAGPGLLYASTGAEYG